MVKTVAKGNKRELEARKKLETHGWITERKNRTRFHSPDFWGVFDLACIKRSRVKLVQVKSSINHVAQAKREVLKFVKSNKIELIECEVWLRENRKDWRVWALDSSLQWVEKTLDNVV